MQQIKSLHQATMSFINGLPIGSPFTTKEFITALQLFRAALKNKGRKISEYQTYGNDNNTLKALVVAGIVEKTSRGKYKVIAHTMPGFSRTMLEVLGHGRTRWSTYSFTGNFNPLMLASSTSNSITEKVWVPKNKAVYKEYIVK